MFLFAKTIIAHCTHFRLVPSCAELPSTSRVIFTARKRSLGKVMFYRHLSVWGWGVGTSHTSWDRPHVRVPPPLPSRHQTWGPTPFFPWTSDLLGTYPLPATDIWWLSLRPVQICSIEDLLHCSPPPPTNPLVLVSSGGHRNTYGWQAGGTHPTGMMSCCNVA